MSKKVKLPHVQKHIEEFQGTGKSFAEFLASVFNGRLIEIYLGDAYENISVDQISTSYPAVFCGKVVGAYKESLIISAAYVDENKMTKMGNLLFINERAIRLLTEIGDGETGRLSDMFLSSKDAKAVKKIFNESEGIVEE